MNSLTSLSWDPIKFDGKIFSSQAKFKLKMGGGDRLLKVTLESQTDQELRLLMKSVNEKGLSCLEELTKTFDIGGEKNKFIDYVPIEEKIFVDNQKDKPIFLKNPHVATGLNLQNFSTFAESFKHEVTLITPPPVQTPKDKSAVKKKGKSHVAETQEQTDAEKSSKSKVFNLQSRIEHAKGRNWNESYDSGNAREIVATLAELTRIAREEDSPRCERLTHEILARTLAYRNCSAYIKRQNTDKGKDLPPLEFEMRIGNKIVVYEYKEEVDLLGGLCAAIFAPKGPKLNQEASPLVLFTGTITYYAGRASGVSVADDFNALGPGDGIARFGANDLEKALKQYGSRANLFGHSLGGALAIRMSVQMPHLVKEAYAYNAPRQAVLVKGHYDTLKNLHDFISDNYLGEKWGISKSQIIKLLNHPSLHLKRSGIFNSKKTVERTLCEKFKVLLTSRYAFQTPIDDNEILQLIKLSQKIKSWRHGYKVIPEEMPQLHSYVPVMQTEDAQGKPVQTNDPVTSAGHDLIGNVYQVHFKPVEPFAKMTMLMLRIHGQHMFRKLVKVVQLTPEEIKQQNDAKTRTAFNVSQVAATSVLGTLATTGITIKRFFMGSDDRKGLADLPARILKKGKELLGR